MQTNDWKDVVHKPSPDSAGKDIARAPLPFHDTFVRKAKRWQKPAEPPKERGTGGHQHQGCCAGGLESQSQSLLGIQIFIVTRKTLLVENITLKKVFSDRVNGSLHGGTPGHEPHSAVLVPEFTPRLWLHSGSRTVETVKLGKRRYTVNIFHCPDTVNLECTRKATDTHLPKQLSHKAALR